MSIALVGGLVVQVPAEPSAPSVAASSPQVGVVGPVEDRPLVSPDGGWLLVRDANGMQRSSDGAVWEAIPDPPVSGAGSVAITNGGTVVWVHNIAQGARAYRYVGGVWLGPVSLYSPSYYRTFGALGVDANGLYLPVSSYKRWGVTYPARVMYSNDGGASWNYGGVLENSNPLTSQVIGSRSRTDVPLARLLRRSLVISDRGRARFAHRGSAMGRGG